MGEHSPARVVLAILVMAAGVSGCGTGLVPPDLGVAPGSRALVIPVANDSRQPAELFVASPFHGMDELVGQAIPSVVQPGETVDVTFIVPPPGGGWAIFVNPTDARGGLIGSVDIPPDAEGELPVEITVLDGGDPVVSGPSEPGWFGN